MTLKFADSAEKMITLLGEIATHPVHVKKNTIDRPYPRIFKISGTFWRDFKCPAGCTACCQLSFSIDFIPSGFEKSVPDDKKHLFEERTLTVNGVTKKLYTIPRNHPENGEDCIFLINRRTDNENVKGCSLYPHPPLSCKAGPQIKFMTREDSNTTYLTKRPFGRAWAFPEEPQCEFEHKREVDYSDDLDTLKQFRDWAEYFEINTVIDHFIERVERAKHMEDSVKLKFNYNKLF